jgi:hypothetical protein
MLRSSYGALVLLLTASLICAQSNRYVMYVTNKDLDCTVNPLNQRAGPIKVCVQY